MKLKMNPKKAYLQIDACIKSGYELRDFITGRYGVEMTQDVLDDMNRKAKEWIASAQSTLLNIFPTSSQSDAFLRITSFPFARSGWNIKHNALLNHIQAQVDKLMEYQRIVNTYISKPLERPLVNIGISLGSAIVGAVVGSLLTIYLTQ